MNKLFYDDPYQTECTATVVKVEGNEVVLDQTVFFAFSGGQASDSGSIGGIPVTEAVAGDEICYTLASPPPFAVGDEVKVVIDQERRMKLMRLHSAVHVVSFLFDPNGEREQVGSNITPEKGRLDYAFPEPLTPLLSELEKKVNDFCIEEHAITFRLEGEKRIWCCERWEVPCGGTHVRSTQEIGSLKLKRKNIGSGKERIEITLLPQ